MQRCRGRKGGRIKENGTKGDRSRIRDGRLCISIALRLSLWLGFSVSFSRKSYIVSPLRSYGRGLKYILLFSAGSTDTSKSGPQTGVSYVTHVCQKQQQRRLPSSATFAGIQSFLVHSVLVAHSVSFCRCLYLYRLGIPPSRYSSSTFELNSVSSNWTVERIVCWSGNRALREFVGLSHLFVFVCWQD